RLYPHAAPSPISPQGLGNLRAPQDHLVGGVARNKSNWGETGLAAADLRAELSAAARAYIYQLFREGPITDEARRHTERELDLEEASIARKKEGGVEPPL